MRFTVAVAALLSLAACASGPEERAAVQPYRSYVRVAVDAEGGREVVARGEAEPGRAVSAEDPVRVASISKFVTMLAVLRLAGRGILDLDADVSEALGWTLRNPAAPDVPVTLRQLLSHRSSLNDGAGYNIPLGTSLRDFLTPASWRGYAPGEAFEYSNLGFAVIASVMEAATGDRFDGLMMREVFWPLGIDACFNWSTCSDEARARGVALYDAGGALVKDGRAERMEGCRAYKKPEDACDLRNYRLGTNGSLFSPQGGLRISMKDLAKIGATLAVPEKRRAFLSDASWRRLKESLEGGRTGEPAMCVYGLAVQLLGRAGCTDDPFQDGAIRIGHSGNAYDLRSGLWIDESDGRAVAYFVSGVPRPEGPPAFGWLEVERQAARGTLD